MRATVLGCLLLALAAPAPASAAVSKADATAWHDALLDAVAADLAAGKPLVVQVHVPLCSNEVLRCGKGRLGDGDDPDGNLYWATSGGFRGWFGRKGSGWTLALVTRDGLPDDVLEARAWRRRVKPGKAWRKRGVQQAFDVVVVAYAWRGTAIDRTVDAYVADLYGDAPRPVTLADGTSVDAGGAAHVVAYVGHNRWMDYAEDYDFAAAARAHRGTRVKGTIAEACRTADYLAEDVPAPTRVPLLMTSDFLFAGAHAFEGAVVAFAEARPLADIRAAAAASYAVGQGKKKERVAGAFTNPADTRWK